MKQILVVAGPTAGGKTDFAIRLAQHYGGEVISADSIQIYQKLNIASAKPTQEEMQGIPHHLLDFVSPFASFSVAEYVKLAKEKIDAVSARGNLPIVVGGTGLYISSLVDNVEFAEETPNVAVRQRLWAEKEEKGIVTFYERLRQIDPTAAEKIHPHNEKRVIRALEIFETTGLTMTEQNERSRRNPAAFNAFMIALTPPREVLYERINRRVDTMVACGLFEEAEALRRLGLTREMQCMQGIGYKEVFDCLDGLCSRDDCIETIKQATRRYAKRQLTWFRRDARYHWLNPIEADAEQAVLEAFVWKRESQSQVQ